MYLSVMLRVCGALFIRGAIHCVSVKELVSLKDGARAINQT